MFWIGFCNISITMYQRTIDTYAQYKLFALIFRNRISLYLATRAPNMRTHNVIIKWFEYKPGSWQVVLTKWQSTDNYWTCITAKTNFRYLNHKKKLRSCKLRIVCMLGFDQTNRQTLACVDKDKVDCAIVYYLLREACDAANTNSTRTRWCQA